MAHRNTHNFLHQHILQEGEKTIQEFAAVTETSDEKSAATEMERARQRLVEIFQREVLPLINAMLDTKEAGELAKLQEEARVAEGKTDEVLKTLIGHATRCSGSMAKKAELARNEHAGRLAKARTLVLGSSVGAGLIGGLLGFWLARNTTRSIQLVANALSASAEQTASAAAQVSSASQSLATGVGEQSAALEQTSASLEEMSGVTKNNSDSAQCATNLAKETTAKIEGAIGRIDQGVEMSKKVLRGLQEIVAKIRQVDDMVAEVAAAS